MATHKPIYMGIGGKEEGILHSKRREKFRQKLQPWTNCVRKCLKTSNHDQKPTKTTSCTPFPLSMLENSTIQTYVT